MGGQEAKNVCRAIAVNRLGVQLRREASQRATDTNQRFEDVNRRLLRETESLDARLLELQEQLAQQARMQHEGLARFCDSLDGPDSLDDLPQRMKEALARACSNDDLSLSQPQESRLRVPDGTDGRTPLRVAPLPVKTRASLPEFAERPVHVQPVQCVGEDVEVKWSGDCSLKEYRRIAPFDGGLLDQFVGCFVGAQQWLRLPDRRGA